MDNNLTTSTLTIATNALPTDFIEFVPVILIGFVVAAYKSLKAFLGKREHEYEESEVAGTQAQKPRYTLSIATIITDGIGGAIVGSIVYGLMSLTSYSYTIKMCLSAVASFVGVDKVMGYIEKFVKNKAHIHDEPKTPEERK